MDFLNNINWTALLIVACFGASIVGLFAWAFSLLRGDKGALAETSTWSKVISGAREGQRRQDSQMAELHRLVSALDAKTPDQNESQKPDFSEKPGFAQQSDRNSKKSDDQ
jgi:hypothetical protein